MFILLLLYLGYEATVFGVHHTCDVKIPGDPIITVVPKMPRLRVRCFPVAVSKEEEAEVGLGGRRLSKASMEKFDLMDGESCEFCFELEVDSDENIVSLTAAIKKQESK